MCITEFTEVLAKYGDVLASNVQSFAFSAILNKSVIATRILDKIKTNLRCLYIQIELGNVSNV